MTSMSRTPPTTQLERKLLLDQEYSKAMMRLRIAASLALGSVLLLAGCQAGGKDYVEDWAVSPEMGIGADMAVTEDFAPRSTGSVERFDIITGDMYLTVEDTAGAADEVTSIVVGRGGRVDSRTDYLDVATDSPASYLWVRIPADVLDDTLDDIQALGVVERTSTSRVDVTLQVVDLNERIDVLNASLDRLNALLEQAETTSELIDVETAITARQAERDSLVAQQKYLADQIQFASVSIELRTDQDAPPRDPGGFVDAIVTGWLALVAFASASFLFLGMSLPWLVLGAIILTPIVWLIVRRRRRAKA